MTSNKSKTKFKEAGKLSEKTLRKIQISFQKEDLHHRLKRVSHKSGGKDE